jgi:hypothetical protein
VWVLEQADLKRKKQIAKEHAAENIKFIRAIVEEHMKLDIEPTWNAPQRRLIRLDRSDPPHRKRVFRVPVGFRSGGSAPEKVWSSLFQEGGASLVRVGAFEYQAGHRSLVSQR